MVRRDGEKPVRSRGAAQPPDGIMRRTGFPNQRFGGALHGFVL
jgi:hypothetical protein